MKATMKLIVSRLQEGSTWAGLGGVFATNAMLLGSDYEKMLGACALICFAIGALLRDPGHVD